MPIYAIEGGSCVKSPQILHAFGTAFFWRDGSRIVDLHYKIQPDNDHVAMFHGDRPTELGDPATK